jgi:glycosyltransferase involved in cell wall biosynthesis
MTPARLRVLFDAEVFSFQVHGGISRYFVELLAHLPDHGVDPVLVAPITFNHHLAERRPAGWCGLAAPGGLRNRYSELLVQQLLRASDEVCARLMRFDLLHRTFYGPRSFGRHRRVTTVVDMIPELLPDFFPSGSPHLEKAAALAESSLIICISQQTKADLQQLMPGLHAPIEVIHLAVDSAYFTERAARAGGEDGTILFVGSRVGYKNFGTFAKATALLLAERLELRAMVVGGGPLSAEELAPFVEEGVADRVIHRAATDAELPTLYRRASAFVFPSRYEGFGLPILEAFASGCPVVLADASCFPEIAEDAGLYFDPDSPESLLEALRRVTGDAALRTELRARGGRRLAAFSWDRTAELTAAAYRRVVQASR